MAVSVVWIEVPPCGTCWYLGGRRLERRFHSFSASCPMAAGTCCRSLFCRETQDKEAS